MTKRLLRQMAALAVALLIGGCSSTGVHPTETEPEGGIAGTGQKEECSEPKTIDEQC